MTPDVVRYLTPLPAGAVTWLGKPAASVERTVFEHFLRAGQPLLLDLACFADKLNLPAPVIGRALFALNRDQSLSVLEGVPRTSGSWVETGLAGVGDDLAALAAPGQNLLLASEDGLSIARVGWTRYEAEVLAARKLEEHRHNKGEVLFLHFGAHSFVLSSNARVDLRNAGLLRLGYRLLDACGPLV